MTRKILLAALLAFASATLSFAPAALACGGYGPPDPTEVAIRGAVMEHTARPVGDDPPRWVHSIRVDGDRATAIVRLDRGEAGAVEREVRLVRRTSGWRVTHVGAPRALG